MENKYNNNEETRNWDFLNTRKYWVPKIAYLNKNINISEKFSTTVKDKKNNIFRKSKLNVI